MAKHKDYIPSWPIHSSNSQHLYSINKITHQLGIDQRSFDQNNDIFHLKPQFIPQLSAKGWPALCHCVLSGAAWPTQCKQRAIWCKQDPWRHQYKRNKSGTASDILINFNPEHTPSPLRNGALDINNKRHIPHNKCLNHINTPGNLEYCQIDFLSISNSRYGRLHLSCSLTLTIYTCKSHNETKSNKRYARRISED